MKINNLLSSKIKTASQAYYEGNPIISDSEFDKLLDELKAVDPNNPILSTIGFGYDINNKANKVKHGYGVVGSLDKVKTIKDLPDKFKKKSTVISCKLDGSSCVAYYVKGKLLVALTRGDGITGVDVTTKFNKITEKYDINVPDNFTGAIRGEVVFTESNWKKYLLKYPEAQMPRNISTGLLMRNDISEDLEYIDWITYKIAGSVNQKFNSYKSVLRWLEEHKFPTVQYIDYDCETDEHLLNIFNLFTDCPSDGLVLTSTISSQGNNIIYDDIAYKFQSEITTATVTGVTWNLTRTNKLVPIVNIEPVYLSGAVITKATGFNAKFIEDNGIEKGAKIEICRSGEVIPYIVSTIKPEKLDLPMNCPVCGKMLMFDGTHLSCVNKDCPNIYKSRILNFIEVCGCKDILGVGPAVLEQLMEVLNVNTITELYNRYLTENELNMFTPANRANVIKVMNNIHNPIKLEDLLVGLSIPGLGLLNAKKVGRIIYDNVNNPNLYNKLCSVYGLGDALASNVISNLELIKDAFNHEIIVETNDYVAKIVITGALSIPRKQFELLCKQNNVELIDNVGNADYLVTNEISSNSSKFVKATKLGIPKLTEKEFREQYIH